MNEMVVVIGCVFGIVAGKVIYHLLFDDADDFCECLSAAMTPDILSLINGDLLKNMGESFRMSIFLWIPLGAGYLMYLALTEVIKNLF